MMKSIIRVEQLSKQYGIGARQAPYGTLRDTIAEALRAPITGLRRYRRKSDETIWALKDVSFEILPGEVVGIIGRNGAGKSTLLKVLSRITEPTTGRVELYGRVASLLEVGTGFHPELTGRENIYLNGAILGMKRTEIEREFDEIVAFAEIEKFLDTPVKRYSSGMYMRLAFAIAAHLEPEILIIDEVLAVGDASFQKKCLGKMEDVSVKEGRTVLFVSHNMGMITSLCTKAFLLQSGKIIKTGSPSDVILEYYTKGHSSPAYVDFTKMSKRIGDDYAELLECHIKNSKGDIVTEIDIREPITVGMRYRILRRKKVQSFHTYPLFNFFSGSGEIVFGSMAPNSQLYQLEPGEYLATCFVPGNFLNDCTYFISLGLASCDKGVRPHFYEENALSFHVKDPIEETLYETRNGYGGPISGLIRPKLEWKLEKMATAMN
jgi:lipopolysaccharide transport system ATP-binding protein